MSQKKTTITRIFVVEDDFMYRKMVKYIMELNPDHEVHAFETGKECLDNLHLKPDIISLDYALPDMSGEEVFEKIKAFDDRIRVIILSGQKDVATAVRLVQRGAFDYITKNEETKERLLSALARAKRDLSRQQELDVLREEVKAKYDFRRSIVGASPAMEEVFHLISKASRTNITVSITGETGTGKELVAKAIHYNSRRSEGPFVAVNMSAIPRELLESELFGHEKGAFTGASARKPGQFELANKGTLFLDEIAELDLGMQAKLLRALQEREVRRVGGTRPVKFDARIITATHKNLAELVREGKFREDLYYRLLGLPIKLPPLRERDKDIILLANHFLKAFAKENNMPVPRLSREAKNKLMAYPWPGNVRELKAVVELAAVMASGETIEADDIQFSGTQEAHNFLTHEMTMEEYKYQIVFHFLEKYNNDVQLVAKKLDIGKSTIYRMLQEYRQKRKRKQMQS